MSPPVSPQNEMDAFTLHEKMFEAAEQGKEIDLRNLLVDWKQRELEKDIIDGCLMGAIAGNQATSVKQLMDYGAMPAEDTLSRAVEKDVSMDIWQVFLDHGWNINSRDLSGNPVIFNFLSETSIFPRLTWFLTRDVSLEARSRTGQNAISYAAGYRPVPVLRALLEHSSDGANLANTSNAIHEAASNTREDRTAALELLVDDFGADVNVLSAYGKRPARNARAGSRPLHCAVRSERREHVRFLLDRGAKVTEMDADGLDVRVFAEEVGCEDGWRAVEEWFAEKGLVVPRGEGGGDEPVGLEGGQ